MQSREHERERDPARVSRVVALGLGAALACGLAACVLVSKRPPTRPSLASADLHAASSVRTVQDRTRGCVSCHVGKTEPHPNPAAPETPGRFAHLIGCVDCHGGNAAVVLEGPAPDWTATPREQRDPALQRMVDRATPGR